MGLNHQNIRPLESEGPGNLVPELTRYIDKPKEEARKKVFQLLEHAESQRDLPGREGDDAMWNSRELKKLHDDLQK